MQGVSFDAFIRDLPSLSRPFDSSLSSSRGRSSALLFLNAILP